MGQGQCKECGQFGTRIQQDGQWNGFCERYNKTIIIIIIAIASYSSYTYHYTVIMTRIMITLSGGISYVSFMI